MTDQHSDRSAAIAAARSQGASQPFREGLGRLIAFPTDATAPGAEAPLAAFLDHAGTLLSEIGFDLIRTEADGYPFLIARRIEDPALPTVLSYSHGDTVPGMEGRWREGRDPWTLTEAPAEGRLYGRGIADNKGQFWVNLTAMRAVLEARGKLGFNAIWLIEMGEEIGSPGLDTLCRDHADNLAADILVASDGPRVSADRPTIFLGARGARTFRLHLRRREGGRHSGNFGGLLRNPGLELAHALTTIAGPRGEVLVPGWTPARIDPAARTLLAGIEPAGGEVDEGWGTPGLSPAERVHGWCSAEILAFTCGDPGHPVNAIPPEATAWVQLRHVAGLDADGLRARLVEHLAKHGHGDIEVSEDRAAFPATATPPTHPAVGFAAASVERTTGAPPAILPSLGGSLPNDVFTDTLGLPTIWVPHSYPGCSQHAPDEHLPTAIFPDAVGVMAGLYWDLGTEDALALRKPAAAEDTGRD
ncbi:M20/M25/M40 family metallo-hydrolase [Roseibacterium sp. SDUM158016]|uniref:M20/M25/M40 family metallo-hydrolase n=1 Tax=Roseicyclus sediminis TaxID=2980997 RepID=UPI0021D22263|nr:M20/M25/M40 family metallo-hydrolase [Roseibacterium sp. SDUM158016]MCU4651887.1 M20/M25/M40 family metallo-hydrolase [Roseibacterium sp. SDUM158016]